MKLHILSDLHLEMGDYTPAVPAADLVILAGDIHKGALTVLWACREYPQLPVRLWVDGHTHYNHDYTLGPTRIISNQRSYPHEATPGFDPKLIIEI